jgi:hypothetical protein
MTEATSEEKEVRFEADGKSPPWGKGLFLRTQNGLKMKLNTQVVSTLAFPAAALVAALYYSHHPDGTRDPNGHALETPGLVMQVPLIESPIWSDRDRVNEIARIPVRVSPMGRIQVFNLQALTDIPVGSEAKATLSSGASNGIVKARLTSPMLVDGEPILPEGAIVFGRGKSTEERLFVEFTRVIFPSGDSYPIRAEAFDESDRILGLKGALVGSKTKMMAMGMVLGFMGGMADGLQDTSGSMFEMERRRSVRDAALSGSAKATLDQSQMYLDQVKNSPDIIEVKQGTAIYVIVDEPKTKNENEDK